eukprot:4752005-Pleurochrysis_carterae.AAC.1
MEDESEVCNSLVQSELDMTHAFIGRQRTTVRALTKTVMRAGRKGGSKEGQVGVRLNARTLGVVGRGVACIMCACEVSSTRDGTRNCASLRFRQRV